MKTGDGPSRAGRDRIIVEFHTVNGAQVLHAMRNTGERLRDLHKLVAGDQIANRGERCQIVFYIVHAGDADVL